MRLLGLHGLSEVERARAHLAEYTDAAGLAWWRLGGQVLAGLMAAAMCLQAGDRVLLGGWLAGLVLSIGYQARLERLMTDGARAAAGYVRAAMGAVGLNVALWAGLVLACGPHMSVVALWGLWAVIALWITVSGLVLSTVLVTNLALCAGMTAVLAASAYFAGERPLAVVLAAYGLLVMAGAIERTRLHIRRRLAEARMDEHEDVVRLLLHDHGDGSADWLWQIDARGRVCEPSERFVTVLDRPLGDIDGVGLLQLIGGDTAGGGSRDPGIYALAQAIKDREPFSGLLLRVCVGGVLRWWEMSGRVLRDGQGGFVGYRGVGSDVTAQRETSERISYLAQYDALTRLPNRLLVMTALTKALVGARGGRDPLTACFMLLDLDRFKAVNDTLGHPMGDKLLCEVAARLGRLMEKGDLCGRLGGDEFAVVLSGIKDEARIERLAQKIIDQISAPYDIDGHVLHVGTSIGSARAPLDGESVDALMRNADLALYRAKSRGRMQHCRYHASLLAEAEQRREREAALHAAVESEAFGLLYQPIVEGDSERLVSFEALLRWRRPGLSDLTPDHFLDLAEETHLIVPLGNWVLRKACAVAAGWAEPIGLQLNISPGELLDGQFIDALVLALGESGLAPGRLELEVTENVFQRDADLATKQLEAVCRLGCRVALDDFGTGHSALSHLRRVPFSTIKVDRSFVQGAASRNPEYGAMIRAVVAMARSLEMKTIAEGVETEAERAIMRELGCDRMQGYLFGRPMASAEIDALFARRARSLG